MEVLEVGLFQIHRWGEGPRCTQAERSGACICCSSAAAATALLLWRSLYAQTITGAAASHTEFVIDVSVVIVCYLVAGLQRSSTGRDLSDLIWEFVVYGLKRVDRAGIY